MARCSHCGGEITEGLSCRACGLEIQYKDFKGSEMLYIKMPSSVSKSNGAFEQKSLPAKKEKVVNPISPKAKRVVPNKPAFLLLAAVTIILSCFGWYYVLKFLLKF